MPKTEAQEKVCTKRLVQLLDFDRQLSSDIESLANALASPGSNPASLTLIGTDEVGRGCLAGPVVAAAVIMPQIDPQSALAIQLARINDSKQVKPADRVELSLILQNVCQFAIGAASVAEIDKINILNASLLAMRRAVRKLKPPAPTLIAVDGNKKIKSIRIEQITIIDGDTKSASIAAASIIAKVHRDAFMVQLSQKFPQYSWESNKGYRSRAHWKALDEHGMTKWHRRSFVERWLSNSDFMDKFSD